MQPNTLSSLQSFYDTVENHIRGLSSLSKSPESYSDLLTPIIFGKPPKEIQKSLARRHNNTEWTFVELRASIMKEINQLTVMYHHQLPLVSSTLKLVDTLSNHQTLGM